MRVEKKEYIIPLVELIELKHLNILKGASLIEATDWDDITEDHELTE